MERERAWSLEPLEPDPRRTQVSIFFLCLFCLFVCGVALHKIRSVAVQLHKQHLLLLLFCATQEVPKNKSSKLGAVFFCFPAFPSLSPCSSSFFLASNFSILFLLAPLCFFFLPVFFSSSSFFSSVFFLPVFFFSSSSFSSFFFLPVFFLSSSSSSFFFFSSSFFSSFFFFLFFPSFPPRSSSSSFYFFFLFFSSLPRRARSLELRCRAAPRRARSSEQLHEELGAM